MDWGSYLKESGRLGRLSYAVGDESSAGSH